MPVIVKPKPVIAVTAAPKQQIKLAVVQGSNATTLDQLDDVQLLTPEPNDTLIFNGSKWQAQPLDGGEFN